MKTLLKNCALRSGVRTDILVEDGLIVGIGSFATADQVYDMTGYAAVLPCFIDAHMHLITGNIPYEDTFLRAWAQAGVTTLRDLGVGDDMRTYPTEKFITFRDKTSEDPECAQCLTSGRFVAADGGYGNAMMDTLTGYGGKVAVGTDAMRMEIQPEVAGMPLRELRLLHEAGLSVDEVIDTATINAAEVCGIADQVGSIAVGKRANLIAVKDPIDEGFDALAHVEFVMNRGVVIKNI